MSLCPVPKNSSPIRVRLFLLPEQRSYLMAIASRFAPSPPTGKLRAFENLMSIGSSHPHCARHERGSRSPLSLYIYRGMPYRVCFVSPRAEFHIPTDPRSVVRSHRARSHLVRSHLTPFVQVANHPSNTVPSALFLHARDVELNLYV